MASGASHSNRYVQVNQHILEQRRIQQTAESRWLADTSEGAKIVTGSFSRTSLSLCFWCWKQCSWFQSFKARPESENHFDVLGFQMDQVWRTGFQSFCISVGSTANGLARTSLSGGLPQFLLEASWPSNVPAMTTLEAKTLASRAQQLSCVYTPENQHEIWKLTPQGGGFFFESRNVQVACWTSGVVPHLPFLQKTLQVSSMPGWKDPLTKSLHAPQMLEAGNVHKNLTETPLTCFAHSPDLATNPASHTQS